MIKSSLFEPVIRPFLRAFWRLSRGMTLGVRGVAENAEGRVVLVRHTYVDGLYLPGGGVERGETAETALGRELAEEAGIALQGAPRLWGVYSNERLHRGDHVLLYRIGAWRDCAPDFGDEIAETVWIDPHDPPAEATPGTRRRLAEIYGGAQISAHW